MEVPANQTYTFRGGLWHKFWGGANWPFGILKISPEVIVLRDTSMNQEYQLSKSDVVKIEMRKYLGLIGCRVKISHNRKDYSDSWNGDSFIFGSLGSSLDRVAAIFRKCGWLQ